MEMRLAACSVCHGKQGQGDLGRNGGVYPRLAGQPAGYLYLQMKRFKSEKRTGIPPVNIMHRLLVQLSDNYLHLIARYYHTASPPYPPGLPSESTRWPLGRKLVRQGLPQSGIAPCTQCHGTDLQGQSPTAPALAGQYALYLKIQFTHWIQGARHNPVHDHIAQVLSPEQIKAVTHYLASLHPNGHHHTVGEEK
jgi:cytochrome c553